MKPVEKIKNKFNALPLGIKMHLSFVLPIVILSVFENLYKDQINYSIERANTQADAFISNYLSNLKFIVDQIKSDQEIRGILEDKDFGKRRD